MTNDIDKYIEGSELLREVRGVASTFYTIF